MFRQLLPTDVIVVVATGEMWCEPLHPSEEPFVERAVPKRGREFRAGRACARKGLSALGITDFALCPAPDRSPCWPADVLGSITHRAGLCAAAVCRRSRIVGLGIDVERNVALDPGVIRLVCTEGERAELDGLGSATQWATLVFSAKESIYKSYYPATRTFLDFHDVEVVLFPDCGEFVGHLVTVKAASLEGRREFHGRYACTEEHVFTAVAVE
jgi:4'-phosphopantetheinyl transferase EntD